MKEGILDGGSPSVIGVRSNLAKILQMTDSFNPQTTVKLIRAEPYIEGHQISLKFFKELSIAYSETTAKSFEKLKYKQKLKNR